MVRDRSSYGTRCFACRASVQRGTGALWYFSFTRGGYWKVPICRVCVKDTLAWADARRRVQV